MKMSALTGRKKAHLAQVVRENEDLVRRARAKAAMTGASPALWEETDSRVPDGATPWVLNGLIAEVQQANAGLRAFLGDEQKTDR